MKFLIAGLGNIGPEYSKTRHNIGFMILHHFAEKNNLEFSHSRHVFRTEFKYKSHIFHFIKPTTFMNLSGKAISYWLQQEKIDISRLLVITDDIALPYAKIRLKPSGSHGGHNGLRSIEELLGTREYPRLRIGVGDNFPKGQQVNFVLSPFSKVEQEEIPFILNKSEEIILSLADQGIERTMNLFN